MTYRECDVEQGLDVYVFFFNDTATTEIYTLSLHDALPISELAPSCGAAGVLGVLPGVMGLLQSVEVIKLVTGAGEPLIGRDRKSTRLNSSHANISYAVFCLKKKKATRRPKSSYPSYLSACT